MTVSEAQVFFNTLKLNSEQKKVADKVLKNVRDRLEFLS